LETAINLLDQHLRTTIREGAARPDILCSVLSALSHFDLSQVVTIQGLYFSWITEILNSRHVVKDRYRMAGKAVELVWKEIKPEGSRPFGIVKSAWVLPLLNFLQLSEEFYSANSRSAPGALALRILSNFSGSDDFDPKMLPTLTSTLLPTHPLQSRRFALTAFYQFISSWFSWQMESVSNNDRARFLRAVGDPFQSAPDGSPQDEQHAVTYKYEPMKAAVVLIEFALSDLWRDHLRHANFTSCEEIASTVKGKKSALRCMRTWVWLWTESLYTPAKIIAAIERLEELQCPNTAEVVFVWAWTAGYVDPVDRNAWRLIGNKTLTFYQVHGIGRLKTLSRHIMDDPTSHRHRSLQCQVEGVRLPVRIAAEDDLTLARVCQLRRLYQLFGCDPATWEEMVVVERVDEGVDEGVNASLGQSISPAHLMECACDYP
jgi:hypothetical protein